MHDCFRLQKIILIYDKQLVFFFFFFKYGLSLFFKDFFIHLILLNEKYDAHQMSKSCSVPVVVEVEHPSYKATINGHAFTTPTCPPQVISDGINMHIAKI